jgi:hypothetical protein
MTQPCWHMILAGEHNADQAMPIRPLSCMCPAQHFNGRTILRSHKTGANVNVLCLCSSPVWLPS